MIVVVQMMGVMMTVMVDSTLWHDDDKSVQFGLSRSLNVDDM